MQACLVTFSYLEWYRAQQRARARRAQEGERWWDWQRCHGLALAVVQQAQEHDLVRLYGWTASKTGRKKLRRLLREALPPEYRPPEKKRAGRGA